MCNRQLKIDPERQSIAEKMPEHHTIDSGSVSPIFGVAYSISRSSLQTAPIRPVFLSLKLPVPYSETKTGTSGKTTPKTLQTGRSSDHHFLETELILALDCSFWGTLGHTVNTRSQSIAKKQIFSDFFLITKEFRSCYRCRSGNFPVRIVKKIFTRSIPSAPTAHTLLCGNPGFRLRDL